MSEKQLSFDAAMKIVGEQKWIWIKDIERLEKFIQNQQATISALKEENEELKQEARQYWEYKNIKKQKIKDLEKQLKHVQSLIYKKKMQRLEDE